MYNLKNDQSIVIKEADKGSAVLTAFLVKKLMKKFQVTPLFLLKQFMILSKKIEKEETILVIFQIILIQKLLSLIDSIYCLKLMKGCIISQEDQ